ncbi:MAG TPA: zf-HC2 domain-containing protein [Galbitalea sp.]|jgi:anti-sigma factor RsiW
MTDEVDRFRDWDAAYVLGALDSDDRRAYERHLATCPECSAGLAELAGLPGILSKLSSEDAVALLERDDVALGVDDHLRDGVHTPGLVQRLAVAASRRRRRVRFGVLGAAVAVVALITVGGVAFTAGQTPVAPAIAMASLDQHMVTARMSVTQKAWGTRFDWSCTYPGATNSIYGSPVSYDLVVVQKSGTRSVVATWTSVGPHAAGLTASSDIAYGDISSVEVRLTGSSKTLLREDL